MAQLNVSTQRFDPDRNFKFREKWEVRYVDGMSTASAMMPSADTRFDPASR